MAAAAAATSAASAGGGAGSGGVVNASSGAQMAAIGLDSGMSMLNSLIGLRANKKSQQRSFDFQREMSNTAHQREARDLIRAGLNPILSAGGAGATTPPGGIQSFKPEMKIDAQQKLAAYLATKKIMEEIKTQQSNREVNSALTAKYTNDAALSGNQATVVLDTLENNKSLRALQSAQTSTQNADYKRKNVTGDFFGIAKHVPQSISETLQKVKTGSFNIGRKIYRAINTPPWYDELNKRWVYPDDPGYRQKNKRRFR